MGKDPFRLPGGGRRSICLPAWVRGQNYVPEASAFPLHGGPQRPAPGAAVGAEQGDACEMRGAPALPTVLVTLQVSVCTSEAQGLEGHSASETSPHLHEPAALSASGSGPSAGHGDRGGEPGTRAGSPGSSPHTQLHPGWGGRGYPAPVPTLGRRPSPPAPQGRGPGSAQPTAEGG